MSVTQIFNMYKYIYEAYNPYHYLNFLFFKIKFLLIFRHTISFSETNLMVVRRSNKDGSLTDRKLEARWELM